MPQNTTLQNRWIWPFELEEKIGEGGMGVVYRARYVKDDRRVAVKLLPTDETDRLVLARFERELETLKTLRHPNIVHCFGGVCEDRQRFYAMELVDGGTLRELLQSRGRLTWERVIEFGIQICAALDFAHRRGIVHRDIKPGNFLITSSGRIKLSDFGLVSLASESRLTAVGKTMGTIAYMAPEQIRGTPAPSPQTDLYAMGCVLFEMLTGRCPFRGASQAEVMHQHLKDTPPRVASLAPDCPAALENTIAVLLQKRPENRPESAMDVARRLKRVTQTVTVGGSDPELIPNADNSDREQDSQTVSSVAVSRPVLPAAVYRLLIACLVLLAVLTVGNVTLARRAAFNARAEALWVDAYHDSNESVRAAAARALGKLGTKTTAPLDVLIAGLSDNSSMVRASTVKALGTMHQNARPAIPELLRIQKTDSEATIRAQAAETITRIRSAKADPSYGPWILGGLLLLLAAGLIAFRVFRRAIDAADTVQS